MEFKCTYNLNKSYFHPVWKGNYWVYGGLKYKSLRNLKVRTKRYEYYIKSLSNQIMDDIDLECLNSLRGIVK
jgi:hypothetical protein